MAHGYCFFLRRGAPIIPRIMSCSNILGRCLSLWTKNFAGSGLVSRHSQQLVMHRGLGIKSRRLTHQGHLRMSTEQQQQAPAPGQQHQDQKVTPWDVEGEVVDGVVKAIDYGKLMKQFGCQPLTDEMIARLERLTGRKAHVLIRRGMFYCHR